MDSPIQGFHKPIRQSGNFMGGKCDQQYFSFRGANQVIQDLVNSPGGNLAGWRWSGPEQFNVLLLLPMGKDLTLQRSIDAPSAFQDNIPLSLTNNVCKTMSYIAVVGRRQVGYHRLASVDSGAPSRTEQTV